MEKLSRFFKCKREGCLPKTQGGCGSKFYVQRPFDGHQIRLVVFKDHDVRGRRTVYDSSDEESQKEKVGECSGRTGTPRAHPGLCKSVRQRCNKQKVMAGNLHSSPTNQCGRRRRLSSDSTMLSEMIFGSAPMLHKASTMKVHKIKTPPQLMITRVFVTNTGPKESRDSNNSCTSLMDSLDSCSIQTEASAESLIPKRAETIGDSTPLAQSMPMNMPVRQITSENEDSGISTSVTSSISSYTSTPYHSHDSAGSTPSSSVSSYHYNSRLKRHMNTSLQYLDNPVEEPQEPIPISKRPPKIGVGVIFSFPQEDEEGYSYFRSFFFSHVTLIEGHVHKLISAIDTACKRRCRSSVTEALEHLRSSMVSLYTAYRLPEPVWLNLMCCQSQRVPLCDKFLREFMTVVEKCDNKHSRSFMGSLLTGVLSNHLAWVPTVTPAGTSLSSTYRVKHTATWLDSLAKSHPYNPLWAQLSDLYGAIGSPLKLSRTMVTGKKNEMVNRLLYILSYFIRCSELQEVATAGHEELQSKDVYAALFSNDDSLQESMSNSVRSSINLGSCKSDTQMEPPAYLDIFNNVSSEIKSPVTVTDRTDVKALVDDTKWDNTSDEDEATGAMVFQNVSSIAEFCAHNKCVSPSKVEDWTIDYTNANFSELSLPADLSVPELDLSERPNYVEDEVFQNETQEVCHDNNLELHLTENELTAHAALQETNDVSLSEILNEESLSLKEGSSANMSLDESNHGACLVTNDVSLSNILEKEDLILKEGSHANVTLEESNQSARSTSGSLASKESSDLGDKMQESPINRFKPDLNLIECDKIPIKNNLDNISDSSVHQGDKNEDITASPQSSLMFREATSQIIEDQHVIRTRLVGRHIQVDKENSVLDKLVTTDQTEGTSTKISHGDGIQLQRPDSSKKLQGSDSSIQLQRPDSSIQLQGPDSIKTNQDKSSDTSAMSDENFDEYFMGDSPALPPSVSVTPKLSVKSKQRPRTKQHHSDVRNHLCDEPFTSRACLFVVPDPALFDEYFSDTADTELPKGINLEVEKEVNKCFKELDPEPIPLKNRPKLARISLNVGSGNQADDTCVKERLTTDSTIVKEAYPGNSSTTLVKGGLPPASGTTFEPSFSHQVELPLLSPPEDLGVLIPGIERNFGRSLMAGYSEQYMSDFALHGTSDPAYLGRLHGDLTMTMASGALDQDISAAACIVADTDQWSVRLLKCDRTAPDRIKSHEIKASKAVTDMLESVHLLWKMKTSAEFCLMHLEDRLQELYFKSGILAEFLVTNQAYSLSLDSSELARKFGFDESDLPLLLAVAGTLVAPL